MFKNASCENELFRSMEKQLQVNALEEQYAFSKLARALEYLNAAAEIFEQAEMHHTATEITNVLQDLSGALR